MGTPTYNSTFVHVSIEPNIQNNNMLLSNYLFTGIYPVVSTLSVLQPCKARLTSRPATSSLLVSPSSVNCSLNSRVLKVVKGLTADLCLRR